MQVTGVLMVFVDVPREREAEFNRWYDLDHLPEMCATGDVVAARRYYAEDAILKYRWDKDALTPPISPARFCAMYLLGSDDLPGVKQRMAGFGQRMLAQKRQLPSYAKTTYFTLHRLVDSAAAPHIKVSPQARPHIAHRSLQFAMGYVTEPSSIAAVAEWWRSAQYPHILAQPGWAVALRCEPLSEVSGEEGKGKFMHLFLCEASALEAMESLEKSMPEWRKRGSMHPHYQRVFSGPFSTLPLLG
jgi:hypothetical protein